MTNCIKHIIFAFILLITINIHPQSESIKEDISISIRGKALSFFIFEDIYFRTGTIGTEIIYKNRHSLGIDISYWRWRFQKDDPDPLELYDQFKKRTFLYIDYKLKLLDYDYNKYYLNVYSKVGKYSMWYKKYENDSSTINTDFINSTTKGNFYELGIGIGIKHYISNDKRFGVDISINGASRNDNNNEIIYDTGIYQINNNVKKQYYVSYLKLNFFYIIKKSSQ